MSYQETLNYLYQNLPMFQRVGAVAYKKDLTNTIALCNELGNPQNRFKTIHIAGTNGKGSTSHMLASILQSAGYKTGLYTSPHLKEFTERIRVNGKEVSQQFVVDFVRRMRQSIETIQPSFFEITVAMALDYFANERVDVAIIEVGLGGRLDSTNVITPVLSVITNISWDHMDILGDTLEKIAFEKAGIIKQNVPVVISERQNEVEKVFEQKALECNSSIVFATDKYFIDRMQGGSFNVKESEADYTLQLDLTGSYQSKNLGGVLASIVELQKLGFFIKADAIREGLQNVIVKTGLKGRWQQLGTKPLMICDTGHNEAGVHEIVAQINEVDYNHLHMVIGVVKDKDVSKVLKLLPKQASYYFCAASIPRALPAEALKELAAQFGLIGNVYSTVNEAVHAARLASQPDDFIFIGGSTFVVAEVEGL